MIHLCRFSRAVAFGLVVATAPIGASSALANETFEQIKVEAGEKLFRQECRRCHATDATHESYGPPLENVVGRAAGAYPDYDYSDALANSGLMWTDAALRAWMEDNAGFLPGTKMRHVGIVDRTVQDFILAYLHSVSERAAQ